MSKIPVFVSCPTDLNEGQEKKRKRILEILNDLNMEARALGRSDYPKDYPLKEVYILAKHCAGGVVLGFEQIYVEAGKMKRGTLREKTIIAPISIPTPWNQIEAGILFGLKLPLIVLKEANVTGGILDTGSSELFVHTFPEGDIDDDKYTELKQIFLKWSGAVYETYYRY